MVRVSRYIYIIASVIFLFGVTLQVFLAGMVVVAGQMSWATHAAFGHWWGLPVLVMLITAYLGRLPRSTKWLTWILFVVFLLQAEVIIFLRDSVPVVSAFHPVLALADFAIGIKLLATAWALRGADVPAAGAVKVQEAA